MKYLFAILFIILFSSSGSFANIRLPKLVGDNMILQRDTKLKIWGWADPGEKVSLQIQTQNLVATADPQGNWFVELNPLKAGGPYEMTLTGKNKIVFKNILAGDVWLCSGQSNMQWILDEGVFNKAKEIAEANYPNIHQIKVKHATSTSLKNDIDSDGWKVCSPQTVGDFSAVAYFFARDIYKKYNVPIGLIVSAWGGSPIETWTNAEALRYFPDYNKLLNEQESYIASMKNPDQYNKAEQEKWDAAMEVANRESYKSDKQWGGIKYNDKNWSTAHLPLKWEEAGLGIDGIVWYRKEVNIPKNLAGKDLKLFIGKIDDIDSTWFNGVKVGSSNYYDSLRSYTVPGNLVKEGKNLIAIRVIDPRGMGGFWGIPDQEMKITSGTTTIPLAGDWKYNVALDFGPVLPPPNYFVISWQPAMVYNAMIAPLTQYKIKGVLWYQGENNGNRGNEYRSLLPALINGWRTQFAQGEFPFLYVQLANFHDPNEVPAESHWAELREAQLMALSVPNTAMAVAIDLGEAKDIHPQNKQEVGRRLALAARRIAYNEILVYSGPIYESMTVEGNKIRLKFNQIGKGLVTNNGKPVQEISIAGEDKKFVWANAKIEGESIVVWNDNVKEPVAVRYAWSNNPSKANLYNKDGLPASPFRTDNWKGISIK